jgi:ABC-type transporter Mla subunit MlaD
VYPRDAALLRRVGDLNQHLGQVLLEVMQPVNDGRDRSAALRMVADRLREVSEQLEQRADEIDGTTVINAAVAVSNGELAQLATQACAVLQALGSDLSHNTDRLLPRLRIAADGLADLARLLARKAEEIGGESLI